ncbi:hypothetical protein EYF80_026120 [Liparis tanakae]|uniref:Uncharacterized protein n=1 Tax=Liparis tanakae TaxID=230148 RepID=A0A4Z2HFW4_9TELE|nr:hypothetical protein EYF80_026120 [Liparis tanakae]
MIDTGRFWRSSHTLHDKVKGSVKTWKPVFDVVDPSGMDFPCQIKNTAEQVGPQRLQLLAEAQHAAEGLAVLVQTRVELLHVQQRLLVHELQELLGLFGHLGGNIGDIGASVRVAAPRPGDERGGARPAACPVRVIRMEDVQKASKITLRRPCWDEEAVVLVAALAVVPAAVGADLRLPSGEADRALTT